MSIANMTQASITSFERRIVAEARVVLNNPKLRAKDLQEWSTGNIKEREDEVIIVAGGVNAAFKKEVDKRVKQ